MKTTAIICEFNPLHSGHKKIIDYAKNFSDKVICIMSGNFTQRGMPACCDKFARAKHALLSGADLVIELPTVFATASAENFAYGGIAIANKLKVDNLLFGSECGNIELLTNCAKILLNKETNELIAKEVKKGASYPKSVSNVLQTDILNKPNNILAIEYLKSLITSGSKINPITIAREDNYNGEPLQYASSGALRAQNALRKIYTYDFVIPDIDDNIERKFEVIATGLIALKDINDLRTIEGVSEGIENRIYAAKKSQGYNKMLDDIKTKRYTRLRLQRIVLNAILNITQNDVKIAKFSSITAKPLAVKENSTFLLANTDDNVDKITQRADRFYYSLSSTCPPIKLIKLK